MTTARLISAAVTVLATILIMPPAFAQELTDELRVLQRRGAEIVPISRLPMKARSGAGGTQEYQCDSEACWCAGSSDCLDLIDNEGAKCKHFVCGNDHGITVCWCDL